MVIFKCRFDIVPGKCRLIMLPLHISVKGTGHGSFRRAALTLDQGLLQSHPMKCQLTMFSLSGYSFSNSCRAYDDICKQLQPSWNAAGATE